MKTGNPVKKKRLTYYVLIVITCMLIGIAIGIALPYILRKPRPIEAAFQSVLGNFSEAAVSTDARECAVVGKDILQRQGSVADAAIATLLCMGVVIPHSMGIGGGFLLTVYHKASGKVSVLDAREVAPGKATADMFDGKPQNKSVGGLSVAVPGELRGYQELYERFGRLPWSELFQPAIELARSGFPVGAHLGAAIQQYKDRLVTSPTLKKLLTDPVTKQIYKKGDIMKNEHLANVLDLISAANNSDDFYKGSLAKTIIRDIQADGGIMELEDLLNYKARWLEPVKVSLKNEENLTLFSVPPPGSGAILSLILNIMSLYEMNAKSFTSDPSLSYHRLIEAYKFAFAKRTLLQDFVDDELIANITSDEYAQWARSLINDSQTYHDPSHYGAKVDISRDHGTAQLSILAPNGDAISASSTVNLYFGSRLVTANGILLNDEMDDFNSPNITNAFGIAPSDANLIRPGNRPFSSMAPTIILDQNGDVRMTVGASGGTHITTGIASVIFRSIWLHQDIKTSIDAPRLHHQLLPNSTVYEKEFSQTVLKDLVKRNHNIVELRGRGAVIEAIVRDKDGRLYANADYRKQGSVDGF